MADLPFPCPDLIVRALLDGRKTQLRLPLARLKTFGRIREFGRSGTRGYDWAFRDRHARWNEIRAARLGEVLPYAVGDRLWVKEASADIHPLAVAAGRFHIEGQAGIPGPPLVEYRRVYRADGGDIPPVWRTQDHPWRTLTRHADEIAVRDWGWESARCMPRWASRLTLTVAAARVERLQDIVEADAIAEAIRFGPAARHAGHHPKWILGCCRNCRHWDTRLLPNGGKRASCGYRYGGQPDPQPAHGDAGQGCSTSFALADGHDESARFQFRWFWDSLHGADLATYWSANPFVIALTFAVARANIDAEPKAAPPSPSPLAGAGRAESESFRRGEGSHRKAHAP